MPAATQASLDQPGEAGSTLADESYLTFMIPADTNLQLDTIFNGPNGGDAILNSIEQRESLFFGMCFPQASIDLPRPAPILTWHCR